MIVGSETINAGSANTALTTNSKVVTFKLLQNGPGTALVGYVTTGTAPPARPRSRSWHIVH